MTDSTQSPRSRRMATVGWLSIICVLILTYNNCGQQEYQVQESDSKVRKINMQEEVAKHYGASMTRATCADSSKYICHHRIFSEDVDNFEVELDYPCATVNGVELCVSGKQFGFNSKNAKDTCGPNCTESYEYEEFSCYLNYKGSDGSYPIYGASDSFEKALEDANSDCSDFMQAMGK